MSAKLFVGNLSFNTTENDLQDAFAAHGTVVEANLMMDRATGRPRGFAFITMASPEAAQINSSGVERQRSTPFRFSRLDSPSLRVPKCVSRASSGATPYRLKPGLHTKQGPRALQSCSTSISRGAG